jgi:hypothetical protein
MKSKKSKRTAFGTATVLCILILAGSTGYTQTVVSRSRIGGYAEDVTFVTNGDLKNEIVMINGYDLYSAPNNKPNRPLEKLFSLHTPEIDQLPNGIAYIESEKLFVHNNAPHPNKLYLWDQKGTFKGTRNIQYLNPAYRPLHMEGMAYIPESSPTFPDHLLMVVWDDLAGGPNRIEVVRRDGVVVSEIYRTDWPEDFGGGNLGDVAFLSPDRLVVTTYSNRVWTIDFNGNIISGPLTPSGGTGIGEGVVQMKDGRIVATNYPQSLLFFDSNLERQPESDRNDIIGLNLNTANGLGWNSDTNQLLINHGSINLMPGIAAVPTSLDSATSVADLSSFPFTRETAYLPSEHLIAVLNVAPASARAILLFNNNGTLNSQISLSPASLGQNLGPPQTLAYIPTTNEFVVGFNGLNGDPGQTAERRRLRVFSRTGTLVRTLDLTATGSQGFAGVEYFEDPKGGGGRFMVMGPAGRVFTTDLNGDSRNSDGFLFFEFNSRVKLGLITRSDITAITSGPLAGAFAVVDGSGGEVVIFRLD